MLQFRGSDGSVFFLNHLISFVTTCGYVGLLVFLFSKSKKDKLLHSVVSAVITFVLFNFFGIIKLLNYWWLVPIIVLLIGIGKEFVDLANKKKRLFDVRDILADISGIIAVTAIYVFSFLMYVDM